MAGSAAAMNFPCDEFHSLALRFLARFRDLFKRGFRQKGYIPMSVYMTPYKLGDYVDIKVNGAVHKVRRCFPMFATTVVVVVFFVFHWLHATCNRVWGRGRERVCPYGWRGETFRIQPSESNSALPGSLSRVLCM